MSDWFLRAARAAISPRPKGSFLDSPDNDVWYTLSVAAAVNTTWVSDISALPASPRFDFVAHPHAPVAFEAHPSDRLDCLVVLIFRRESDGFPLGCSQGLWLFREDGGPVQVPWFRFSIEWHEPPERRVLVSCRGDWCIDGFESIRANVFDEGRLEGQLLAWLGGASIDLLCLLQAANARTVESPPNRALRKAMERAGVKRPECRRVRLALDGPKRAGIPRGGHRDMPLHKVRGHWKDFTATGLFGNPKRAGWYFVPDHMRGDEDNGTNWHEYRIKGG